VLPVIFDFFLGYTTSSMAKMTGVAGMDHNVGQDVAPRPHLFMQEYLDQARKMLLGFGVVFELPLLIPFPSAIGVVPHRSLWTSNRRAIVAARNLERWSGSMRIHGSSMSVASRRRPPSRRASSLRRYSGSSSAGARAGGVGAGTSAGTA
jgi:hypothetical protein